MAITIIGQEKESAIDKPTPIKTEYLGLSTDTKPTDFLFSLQNVESSAKDLGFIINCYEVG